MNYFKKVNIKPALITKVITNKHKTM